MTNFLVHIIESIDKQDIYSFLYLVTVSTVEVQSVNSMFMHLKCYL